jgi:hypothetical protein
LEKERFPILLRPDKPLREAVKAPAFTTTHCSIASGFRVPSHFFRRRLLDVVEPSEDRCQAVMKRLCRIYHHVGVDNRIIMFLKLRLP